MNEIEEWLKALDTMIKEDEDNHPSFDSYEKLVALVLVYREANQSAYLASQKGDGTTTECDMAYQLNDAEQRALEIIKEIK